jgi:streptogramin lyase
MMCGCLLVACGGGSGVTTTATGAPQSTTQQVSVQGVARAGTEALDGANLTVYGAAAAAQAPQVLGQATTDAGGDFELSVNCLPSDKGPQPIYVIVTGGHASSAGSANSANGAVRLLAMLRDCGQLPAKLTINEFTTIAAAYALNAFISENSIAGNAPGLPNAIAAVSALVDPASGALAASLPSSAACSSIATPTANCEAVEKLDTLANALAACVTSASSNSTSCSTLFSCATPQASDSGSGSCTPPSGVAMPSDTWQAITSIAGHPGLVSSAGIFRLASATTRYVPALAAAPTDWSLALTYAGGGLSEPTALAIDAMGDIWVANYNDAVSEFSPVGTALSPAGGFTGGGLEESFGIAVDGNGNVWVCNEQSPAAINAGLGSVSELAPNGTVVADASGFTAGGVNFPEALMVDGAGHIWIANYGNSTLTELSSDGTPLSPESGFKGGGMSFPVGISADATGNIWIADQGADRISAFSATGAALSPASGYTGGGLAVPQGIAVDQKGNVWISNYYGDSVSEFSSRGVALSQDAGYNGGGLAAPGGIAIDGAGHVWIANFHGASISELSGSASALPGLALSPSIGFTTPALDEPFALAVDPSGNLWVSNFGNDTLTEFIGIAAPVATPLIGVPRSPN